MVRKTWNQLLRFVLCTANLMGRKCRNQRNGMNCLDSHDQSLFKTTYWVSDIAVPFRVFAILDDRSLKVFCEMFRTWKKKRLNWSKRAIVIKFVAIAHFPPKLLAAFCSSHEVMFFSFEELHRCQVLHLAPYKGSQMNITRHVKKKGFIRFKFLTWFPSQQQLSGFFRQVIIQKT